MTSDERNQLYEELIDRLTEIYRSVRAELSQEIVSRAVRPDPSDEAEEGAMDELRTLASNLGDRDRLLAHSMEDALRRMASPDFGRCIDCSRQIPLKRLRLVPWTLRCEEDEALAEEENRITHPTL